MTPAIAAVDAFEILDSRGNPTIRVAVTLEGGLQAAASAPSGASTGENEAIELRDGEPGRYGGKGVRRAVASVVEHIAPKISGRDPTRQAEIDRMLIDLDGTPNKAGLGANAMLGVSMAVARAAAHAVDLPLYAYLGGPAARRLPMPMMNVISGGMHADNSLDFQEFMIVPVGAKSFSEGLRYGAETFHSLKALLKKSGHSTGVGDEGGFAPNLRSNEQACDYIVEAIRSADLKVGPSSSAGSRRNLRAFARRWRRMRRKIFGRRKWEANSRLISIGRQYASRQTLYSVQSSRPSSAYINSVPQSRRA
jgi:enolase